MLLYRPAEFIYQNYCRGNNFQKPWISLQDYDQNGHGPIDIEPKQTSLCSLPRASWLPRIDYQLFIVKLIVELESIRQSSY
jgi:hypothetical protein